MRIDVWSDVVCPWCMIGKANLARALERFEHADQVDVVWHSFELDPEAPRASTGTVVDMLAKKYGRSPAEAQGMIDAVTQRAAEVGLNFRMDRARPGNTFDAHRLLHLAKARGLQSALADRLFRAHFEEGEAIGEVATLQRLAEDVGLDSEEVRELLAGLAWSALVRADQQQARAYGITGVPFFVLDRRLGVGGAQPPDVLLGALRQAWDGHAPEPAAAAEACGPEGCGPEGGEGS